MDKNCLVDRHTQRYNISAPLLFAWFELLSCDSIYLPEVLFVHLNVSTKWATPLGAGPTIRGTLTSRGEGAVGTAQAASLVMDPPQKKIHEAKEDF